MRGSDFISNWNSNLNKINSSSVLALSIAKTDSMNDTQTIYSNEIAKFKCVGVYFVLVPGYTWIVKFQNGTESSNLDRWMTMDESHNHLSSKGCQINLFTL